MFLRLTAAVIGIGVFVSLAGGQEFKPPADGVFSEPQLVQYLDAQKEWLAESAQIEKAVADAKTPAAKAAAGADIDKKFRACLDKHFISKEAYDWVGRQTEEAWGAAAYLDGSYKQAHDQFEGQLKEIDAQAAADKTQVAAYQEAVKNGWRVLSPDDRDAIVKAARTEEQNARDEAKRRGDDADAAEADAKEHDADAKKAEDAAANPPVDMTGDDRADYIQNKQDEARAAKSSAKEARNQEADSKAAEAESLGRADAAAKRAEHPEIPVTEDGKDQAKTDDQAGIESTNKMIVGLTKQRADVVKEEKGLDDTAKKETDGVPMGNVAIMRKYADRYKSEMGRNSGATTRKG